MEIQRSWNEIGFVPMAHKETLQKQFRELTNKWFDQLKIDRESHREAQYQTRLQQMSSHPAGDRELSKEQTQLQYKINDLRKEMDLLENNLGFFSRSKNADLMRQEVEKRSRSSNRKSSSWRPSCVWFVSLAKAKKTRLRTPKRSRSRDRKIRIRYRICVTNATIPPYLGDTGLPPKALGIRDEQFPRSVHAMPIDGSWELLLPYPWKYGTCDL